MRCPRCTRPGYHPGSSCSECQFSGDPALIEEWAHVAWLLDQANTWSPAEPAEAIRSRYIARQRKLEIALGLRLAPFTPEEAAQAWPELVWYETLRHKLVDEWLAAGWVDPKRVAALLERIEARIVELHERLAGCPRPDYPSTDAECLIVIRRALNTVRRLYETGDFSSAEGFERALAPLLAEEARLEIQLGLRPAPEPEPEQSHEPGPLAPSGATPGKDEQKGDGSSAVRTPAPPILPWRERLWRTLVSERTLRAVLFLGIFLLFAAAVSFVFWGWRDFAPALRISIPIGFTAFFFTLGWYVRAHVSLDRSGIALCAIASLLIPIDFYTAYANLDIPADYWPEFWLVTSFCCLGAYIAVTLLIQSPVFAYLVAAATGSVVLATIEFVHKSAGVSRDWYTAGLSVLAVGLILLGTVLERLGRPGRWRVLADPFRYLALLAVGVLMHLTFAWRFIDRETYDTLHYALIINWWLGGFILGWGAVHHRSRSLGLLAATAGPVAVYLAQAIVFDRTGTNPAWHALGWASLVPIYLVAGHKLSAHRDPVIHGHGRTATGWGIALTVVSALWSFTDLASGAAAVSSQTILAGALVLAAALWRRPKVLYAASLLSLSAATFGMAETGLEIAQLGIGWVSLALAHVIIALNLGRRSSTQTFASPVVVAGYVIAALALLSALLLGDGGLLPYVLGSWTALAAWGAYLAHTGQPGFRTGHAPQLDTDTHERQPLLWDTTALFHWLAALSLPFWLWVLFVDLRPPDFSLPLALAVLAWGMIALGHRLARFDAAYRAPWRATGLLVSLAAPAVALAVAPDGLTPAICFLSAGLLYFADAIAGRCSAELAPAGGMTAWACLFLLDRLGLSSDLCSLALALLILLYLAAGLWTERSRSSVFTAEFLSPLYQTTHIVSLLAIGWVYLRPFEQFLLDTPWTDEMRLWGALTQLILGIAYGFYAWGRYNEWWGHLAAWLGAASGGFLFTIYSQGRGSAAAKAALLAIAFVLAERGLRWAWQQSRAKLRWRAFARLAWSLYKHPLLVTGWTVSAGVIGLALIRNLVLLGGGRTQQIWAAAGLLLIVGLYALSARLYRRALFVWLAAILILGPWTILSNLGWFTALRPTVPGFAISWAVLAWALFLTGLWVRRLAPRLYELPLRIVAHVLLPFSLLWGVADTDTSRVTFGLAVGMYILAAWLDNRWHGHDSSQGSLLRYKFRYPAVGLVPVWYVYLVAWLLPGARYEHYGLMFLAFGPLGMAAGRWLANGAYLPGFRPSYLDAGFRRAEGAGGGLPGYLTGYVSLFVGTILVAHIAPLLALALLYDAACMLVSARMFRNPLWVYPAAAMVPISLLLSLHEAGVAANRHGWGLVALSAVYLALGWLLGRLNQRAYRTSMLVVGLALIALGLPPSSQDQVGALWGYASATLLYAIAAFDLRQPLLLTLASVLSVVPYAMVLQRSSLAPEYHGPALFPGALAALALGWVLDRCRGAWRDFPWGDLLRWPAALAGRLLGWWGLPLYALGFGLALASPFFTRSRADLSAWMWALLVPLFAWAIYRFRLRGWLLALGAAAHLAVLYGLKALGWGEYPAWGCLRFLPVTVATALAGLLIERRRAEGTPLDGRRLFSGWSRPLYLLAALDLFIGQMLSMAGTEAGAAVTLVHGLLIGVLASAWSSSVMPYLSVLLGMVALRQWLVAWDWPAMGMPVAFAGLALGYGVTGFGLTLLRRCQAGEPARLHILTSAIHGISTRLMGYQDTSSASAAGKPGTGWWGWLTVWERPLSRSGLILSLGVLVAAGWMGVDLVAWTVRAMLGLPFRQIVDLATIRMSIGVLSLLGLLYVAASVVYRRLRLSYVAIGMLLAGWMLYAFYVHEWDGLVRAHWYAVPAGSYLLGIAYLEWRQGNRTLARWLDYAAMALMIGSLFWQTLVLGWQYALMLGSEGLFSLWWGSARRLRRFFYAGMVGVILATLGQLINQLQSVNQWIAFGIIGLLLIAVAAIVERRLEEIRLSLREVLEEWE